MISIARTHSSNVKNWQNGTMALRWCAAGMIEAGKQFRRVNGHLHLPALRAALDAHIAAQTVGTIRRTCTDELKVAGVVVGRGCGHQQRTGGSLVRNEAAVELSSTASQPDEEATPTASAGGGQQQVSVAALLEGNPHREAEHVGYRFGADQQIGRTAAAPPRCQRRP